MGRIPDIKRLIKEDFPAEQQQLVDKIGFVLNIFMEQVVNILNKKIDFDNLNQEVKTVTVTVDANGIPTMALQIRTSLTTKVQGMLCIKADNLANPNTYPVNAVQLHYSDNGNILTINKVNGLQANQKYSLKVLIIG